MSAPVCSDLGDFVNGAKSRSTAPASSVGKEEGRKEWMSDALKIYWKEFNKDDSLPNADCNKGKSSVPASTATAATIDEKPKCCCTLGMTLDKNVSVGMNKSVTTEATDTKPKPCTINNAITVNENTTPKNRAGDDVKEVSKTSNLCRCTVINKNNAPHSTPDTKPCCTINNATTVNENAKPKSRDDVKDVAKTPNLCQCTVINKNNAPITTPDMKPCCTINNATTVDENTKPKSRDDVKDVAKTPNLCQCTVINKNNTPLTTPTPAPAPTPTKVNVKTCDGATTTAAATAPLALAPQTPKESNIKRVEKESNKQFDATTECEPLPAPAPMKPKPDINKSFDEPIKKQDVPTPAPTTETAIKPKKACCCAKIRAMKENQSTVNGSQGNCCSGGGGFDPSSTEDPWIRKDLVMSMSSSSPQK